MIVEIIAVLLTLGGALYALSAEHLMRGVIGLTALFIGVAVFFAMLGAWFLAVGQLFLFVGGVVALFVLAFNFATLPVQAKTGVWGLLAGGAVLVSLAIFLPFITVQTEGIALYEFAEIFFTQYGAALNVALILLFSALLSGQHFLEVQQ